MPSPLAHLNDQKSPSPKGAVLQRQELFFNRACNYIKRTKKGVVRMVFVVQHGNVKFIVSHAIFSNSPLSTNKCNCSKPSLNTPSSARRPQTRRSSSSAGWTGGCLFLQCWATSSRS